MTVKEPQLTIIKSVSGQSGPASDTRPGDSYTYTVKVRNTGNSPAYDIEVADLADDALTNVVAASGAGWTVDKQWDSGDHNIRWTIDGPLQPGVANEITLTYTADLVASTELSQGQQIPNTAHAPSYWGVPEATRTADGFDYRNYTEDPGDTQTLTVKLPQLQTTKTTAAPGFPDSATASVGEPFKWRIVVANGSDGSLAENIGVNDFLPQNWDYVAGSTEIDGSPDADPAIYPVPPSGSQLVWAGLFTLDRGESKVITFEATPSDQAAIEGGIGPSNPHVNTASMDATDASGSYESADGPYLTADDSAEAILSSEADLEAAKSLESGTLREGSTVVYRLVTTNNGPAVALDASSTDSFPASLQPLSADVVSGPANCTIAVQDVDCDYGPMLNGEERIVDVTARVLPSPPAQITNSVSVSTTSDDPEPDNDTATSTEDAEIPAISIDKRVSGDDDADDQHLTQPGDSFTYSIDVTNDGTGTAYDIEVADLPDAALVNVVASGAGPGVILNKQWDSGDHNIRWTIDSIDPGDTVTLTYTADLAASAELNQDQQIPNTAHAPSWWAAPTAERDAEPDFGWTEFTEDPADTVTLTVDLPQLAITKTTAEPGYPDSAAATVGQRFVWRIFISDEATYADVSHFTVTDVLPPGWSYVPGSSEVFGGPVSDPQISPDPGGDTLVWADPIIGLNIDAPVELTFTAIPTLAALEDGGFGPSNPHVNSASVSGLDLTEASGSADGPYAAGPDTAEAVLDRPEADLEVDKELTSSGPLVEGSHHTYTISVHNNGPSYALDAELTDTLPDILSAESATVITGAGSCDISGQDISCDFGTIAAGDTRVVEIDVRVIPPVELPPPNVINTAAVTTSSTDPERYNDTSTSTEPWAAPDLSLDKHVSGDDDDDDQRPTQPGDSFTYSIDITNDGNAPAYDVEVHDHLDAALTNVVAVDGTGWVIQPWEDINPNILWRIPGPIAPGDTVTLTYTADLPPSAELTQDQQVLNTAHAPSWWAAPTDERDAEPGFGWTEFTDDPSDEVTLTVDLPQLQITKTTGKPGYPDSAAARIEQSFPWRITAANESDYADAQQVVITDTLPPNWSYDPGSAQLSGGHGQIEPQITELPDGDELVWTIPALAAATEVTIDFTATPSSQAAVNPGPGPNINTASIVGKDASGASASEDGPYVGGPDDATANLNVPDIDLAVQKTTISPPLAGDDVEWQIDVVNNGPETAPGAELWDDLPAGTTLLTVSTDKGSCTAAGDNKSFHCNLGEMKVGPAHAARITVRAAVDDPASAGSELTNSASVADSAANDIEPENDYDEVTDTIAGLSDVAIAKRALGPAIFDRNLTYELTVSAAGPSQARDVAVSDQLPSGVSFVSADNPGCTQSAGTVSCDFGDSDELNPGEMIVILITVHVNQSSGSLTNTADVTSSTTDTQPANNHAEVTTPVTAPQLRVVKTQVGDFVRTKEGAYTLDVANVGSAPTYGTVTVTDPMPEGLGVIDASGSGWDCSDTSESELNCKRSDELAAANSYPQIQLHVRIAADAPDQIVNTATVSGGGDPTPSRDSNTVASDVRANKASCAEGGSLLLSQRVVYAGTRPNLRIRVRSDDGRAVKGAEVRVRVAGKLISRRTDAQGAASVKIRHARVGASVKVSVKGCAGLSAKIPVKRVPSCSAFNVRGGYGGSRSLIVGETTRLRIGVTAPDRRPIVKTKVKLAGAGVKLRAKTNRKGNVAFRVTPTKAGIIRISMAGVVGCQLPIGAISPSSSGGQLTG